MSKTVLGIFLSLASLVVPGTVFAYSRTPSDTEILLGTEIQFSVDQSQSNCAGATVYFLSFVPTAGDIAFSESVTTGWPWSPNPNSDFVWTPTSTMEVDTVYLGCDSWPTDEPIETENFTIYDEEEESSSVTSTWDISFLESSRDQAFGYATATLLMFLGQIPSWIWFGFVVGFLVSLIFFCKMYLFDD